MGTRPQVAVEECRRRWSLTLGKRFDNQGSTGSWVAPVTLADGSSAVLKIGMPHMEAEHEIQGLRFWNGDPTVRLLDADEEHNAMLLERCQPGTALRELPEPEQDLVIARMLRSLWRVPVGPHPFHPLSGMLHYWSEETLRDGKVWSDPGIVDEALRLMKELGQPSADDVLLATDLHAGNVLRAQRQPWLMIDPKPFVGDPAFDVTQHLINCEARMRVAPHDLISRMAELLQLDRERIRLWTFARFATSERCTDMARAIAP